MRSLAWRYRTTDSKEDVVASVVAETFARIRTYPFDRRPARIAANITRDVNQRFWRAKQEPVEIDDQRHWQLSTGTFTPNSLTELLDLVAVGVRSNAISIDDAELILSARVFDEPVKSQAHRRAIKPQSVRRNRQRAERKFAESVRKSLLK